MKPRLLAALLAATFLAPATADASTGVPGRDSEPLVVTGNDVPALLGAEPAHVVAFHWDDGWKQVPVQVDERKTVDYTAVRQGNQASGRPFSALAYADPGTFAGADPDPALDGDDEIAAMAMDAGDLVPDGTANPDGVDPGSRVELRIVDAVDPGPTRFLYLFRSTGPGALDPSAGRDYVDYDFKLLSGDYKTTYSFSGVPGGDNTAGGAPANPEDSNVNTDYYRFHLGSRWIGDALQLRVGGATGADILDGDKAQVSYGCGRSELTFSRGGGGFIANIDGPVRAIRSYIGANSGTFTQRDQIYYQRTEVDRTYLRVHPGINRISQFLDYSAAAVGMTYRNSTQPGGVTIDGVADPAVQTGSSLGPLSTWEQVSGPQGTVAVVNRYATNIDGITVGSYYEDSLTPVAAQCSGYADSAAYGASGAAIQMPGVSGGINTDPTLGSNYDFSGTRTLFYGGPGGTADQAEKHAAQVDKPLELSVGDVGGGGGAPNLLLRAHGLKRAEAGEKAEIRAKLKNTGQIIAEGVKVCLIARQAKEGRCARIPTLAPHRVEKLRLPMTVSDDAKRKFRVRVKATSKNSSGSVDYSKVTLE